MPTEAIVLSSYIVILLFSVILHEVMHGYAALKFGDDTAERTGRLTLNPIPHIDPIGTILLPAILIIPAALAGTAPPFIFGWAKPVPVNPMRFRNIKKGELVVSLAGVAANMALALLGAVVFHILSVSYFSPVLMEILYRGIVLNLVLTAFNLLPIPPLDGSKVLMTLLPYNLAVKYQKLEGYGMLILFALLLFPIGGQSLVSVYLGITVGFLGNLLGL